MTSAQMQERQSRERRAHFGKRQRERQRTAPHLLNLTEIDLQLHLQDKYHRAKAEENRLRARGKEMAAEEWRERAATISEIHTDIEFKKYV